MVGKEFAEVTPDRLEAAELRYAQAVKKLLGPEFKVETATAEIEALARYPAWALHTPEGKKRHRQQQMGGKAVVADRGAVDQARGDHGPAQRALEPAQHEHDHQARLEFGREPAAQPEPGERQGEGEADQPAPQPMEEFEPEDLLELGDVEAAVDHPSLRGGRVFLQFGPPGLFRQRRQPPGDRLPFDHGQARLGQPRERAQHDHRKNHHGNDDQPVAHGIGGGLHGAGPCGKGRASSSCKNVACSTGLRRLRAKANSVRLRTITPRFVWIFK